MTLELDPGWAALGTTIIGAVLVQFVRFELLQARVRDMSGFLQRHGFEPRPRYPSRKEED